MPLTRRRPEDKSERWQPRKSVRLYLDDIDEMLAVIRQVTTDVHVETEEFAGTLLTGEELKVAGRRSVDGLTLSTGTTERGIVVNLHRPVSVRIAPRDELGLAGAMQKVQVVLTSREKRFGGWHFGSSQFELLQLVAVGAAATGLGGLLLAAIGSEGSSSAAQTDSQISGWFWLAAGIMLVGLFAVMLWRKLRGPNKAPRRPSFWRTGRRRLPGGKETGRTCS